MNQAQNAKKMKELVKGLRTTPDVLGRVLWDNRQEFIKQIRKTHDAGKDPYNKKWKKRTQDYPWPIMKKTGALYHSFTTERIPQGVSIGNASPYARVHQFGGINDKGFKVPQRMIVPSEEKGLPKSFQAIARRNILKTLKRELPKGFKPRKLVY